MSESAAHLTPLSVGQACRFAKVSYRQAQYWDKTGLVSVRRTRKLRSYLFDDFVYFVVVATLRKAKRSIQWIRGLIHDLREKIRTLPFPLTESVIVIEGRQFHIAHGLVVSMKTAGLIQIDCRELHERFSEISDRSLIQE